MSSFSLPTDLPKPEDDGACNHLTNLNLPSIPLSATSGSTIDLSTLSGLTVVFCYPRTGAPGENIPNEWNAIPGARGCSPQACAFRDLQREFLSSGVNYVFGLSTQDTDYQREAKERLHLPFQLLSDGKLDFVRAVGLPMFEWEGCKLTKRVTMAILDGKVVKWWYPVFPPNENAGKVLKWLENEYQGRENLSTQTEGMIFREMQHR